MATPELRLFAYGTLQLSDILHTVLGIRWQGSPALLPGYGRYRLSGKPYPAIVVEPGANVAGIVYSGIRQAEIERLDVYEGELYERHTVSVRVAGSVVAAVTYVLGEQHRALLSKDSWELGAFEREHLSDYLRSISVTRRAP